MRVLICLLGLAFAGCVSREVPDHLTALRMAAANQKIDLSNGVSEVAAYQIACRYKDNTSEGFVGIPKEEGAQWRVEIFETIAGLHARDVLIDKETGASRVISTPSTGGKEPNPESSTQRVLCRRSATQDAC